MAVIRRKDALTALKKQPEVYSDFPSSFAVQPDSKDLGRLVNERSIIQALTNLVKTNTGERFFNNAFGCDLNHMLFEQVSPSTAGAIQLLIETAIKNYEPRVKLIDVVVAADPDNNTYNVLINFSIVGRQDPITLDLLLQRVR